MWMLAGLVTLIALAWYMYRSRREDRRRLATISTRDTRGKYLGSPPAGSLYTFVSRNHLAPIERLGVEGAPRIQLRVKRKRWWDRLFTALGVSVACRTGNPAFDRSFYLVTDATPICRAMIDSPRTQELMLRLQSMCEPNRMKFRQLVVRRGRAWVEMVARKRKELPHTVHLAQSFVPVLHELSEAMEAEIPERVRGARDDFAWKAALIVGISSAMFITGIVFTARHVFFPLPAPLDSQPLITASIVAGGSVIGLLIVLTFTWLGRTSRTHLVLLELVLVGTIGAGLTSHSLLREANMALDFSAGERHVVQVLDKRKVVSRHTSYFLDLDPWREGQETPTLRVGMTLFSSVRSGRPIMVEEHPGALGVHWVRLAPPPRQVAEDQSGTGSQK